MDTASHATLLAIGQKWRQYSGANRLELVFEGGRLVQVLPTELPPPLYWCLKRKTFAVGPFYQLIRKDLPVDYHTLWAQIEHRYGPLARTLDESNQGFKRGDSPDLEIPIVVENYLLFSFYEGDFVSPSLCLRAEDTVLF